MGRRRVGGAEPLPQAVRRNNAKNERKTMEAMAETLWTSVESGKERRLRLSAERLYGLSAVPGRTPIQQQSEEAAAKPEKKVDRVPTQEKAAEAPAKPDKNADKAPTQQKAGEVPRASDTDNYMVSTQQTTAEAESISGKETDKVMIQQRAAEVFTSPTEPDITPTQQRAAQDSTTPDKEADAVQTQQQVPEASTIRDPAAEVKDVEEAALPDVTLAEAAVPTEGAEVPEQNEEVCLSSWEVVDAPTQNDGAAETGPFEAGEAQVTTQKPVEDCEPSRQDEKILSLKEENVGDEAETMNVNKLRWTSTATPDATASSEQNYESPSMAEEHADVSAPVKEAADTVVEEADKDSTMSEKVETAPVAETAETGVTGKEAALPTASQSDVMTEPVTSTAAPPAEEQSETVTVERDLEVTDSKNDSKKKKKKKKGKQAAEPSTPPATAPTGLENEPSAACEKGQQAKAGKKHKRHMNKRKESQSESEKGANVEDRSEDQVPVTSDAVSETSACPPTSSEMTRTDAIYQVADVIVSATAEPVDEHWTTVETKKTKRKRKRSERKSECEGKSQTDVHHDSEIATEVKTEPNLASEERSITEAIQATVDGTSIGKLADEIPKTIGTTLDNFDRLVLSIGDLKDKLRQASEAKAQKSEVSEKIETQSIEAEQKNAEPSPIGSLEKSDTSELNVASGNDSNVGQNSCLASQETKAKQAAITDEVPEAHDPSLSEEQSTKDANAAPNAFDLLMSAGDGLEAGFNEAFSSKEQTPEELNETELNSLQETNHSTETKPATAFQERLDALPTTEELVRHTDPASDAFDLLMSAGDDLEAGFMDAFGEEEQSEDKQESSEARGEVQVTTQSVQVTADTSKSVEIEHEGYSPVECREAANSECDSTKKEDVNQDAFDLLLSAGDDLETGFKYSFGSEEQVPEEPEQQQTNESTEAKSAPVLQDAPENILPPEPEDLQKSTEELLKETDTAPDAFDLLMSACDDLEAGFNDAFGEEEQSEAKSKDNGITGQVQASTDSNTATGLTVKNTDSVPLESNEASKTEYDVAKETERTIDAFDILMSADDELQEGFKESFSLEEEVTGETKAVDITGKSKDELKFTEDIQQEKLHEDQSATLSQDTVGTELPQTSTVPAGNVDQTMEENTPKEHTSLDNVVPAMSISTPEWFDKTLYNNAEAKYHEQLSLNESRDSENREGRVMTETETVESVVQESEPKASETKEAETVETVSELSSKQTVAPHESVLYDKMSHDNAEARYYERLSRDKISEHCLEDRLSSTPTTSSSSLSVTTKADSPASAPTCGEAVEPPVNENPASESTSKSIVAKCESTWYDKAMHDEAEACHYERLSRSRCVEHSGHDTQVSSQATTEYVPAPAVLSSEQTWFDKPFRDSAETVHHTRQASNESGSSSKSFPLYEGSCDHFKPEDQQMPEEEVEPSGEVESYDSWTESKLDKVVDESSTPTEHTPEQARVVPAEQTIPEATSSPKKETDATDASSGQLDDVTAQPTPTTAQITVNIGDPAVNTGEPPHSPTSDGSRSRRSTFNSAVSPLSPQVELDDYFEDVVLAGRQSDVTMAALRGFTASPLSEGLAPGEQLDSLRTEPDLELSEPGTADTLDDGPFSYDEIGDEGSATPVGDSPVSTAIQPLVSEGKQTSQPSETESQDGALSSTSGDLVMEVNLEVNIPAAELRRDVPSPSLDGGITKFAVGTSITAPNMLTELPPVTLGAEILETMTTTEVTAFDLQAKDIPVPNIYIKLPSVQLTTQLVPEPQSVNVTVTSEDSTAPIMTSTPAKSDIQSSPIPQSIESDPIANVPLISSDKATIVEVSRKEPPTDGTKDSLNISKEPESSSKEINEKLGLNEDGTVPLKEPDEEVIKFTEQGAPRSPVATKRCSRKKKMRSGGRKSSSDSIENQPPRDDRPTPAQDEASKTESEVLTTDVPTQEGPIVSVSDATVAATNNHQPPGVGSATTESKPSLADNVLAASDTPTESVKEDTSLVPQPENQVSPVDHHALDNISVQPKDAVIPSQTEVPGTDKKTADNPETPVILVESQPKPVSKESTEKSEIPVVPELSQLEAVEKELADKPQVAVSITQPETKPAKETESKLEAPASPTEPQSKATETEIPPQSKLEPSIIPTELPSKPVDIPEASVSLPEPQHKPADESEVLVSHSKPQGPQPRPADKPEVPVSPSEPQSKLYDKPEVPVSPPEPQPKPADTRSAAAVKSVPFTTPSKAKPTDPKSISKAPAASRPILPDRTLFLPGDEGCTYASMMQQGADMLPARPVFTAHACHVCKRLHTKQHRLKSCGSCRLVAYCSAEHQRAHWPLHRSLCKVITRRVRHLGTDHLYREALNVASAEQWKKIRFKHMAVCEEMLGRPMDAYEKEMFLYPRACDTCHETNPEKLHTCASCHSVSYCSEDHLRKNHAKYCKDLRTLLDIHSYQNSHGVCEPPLPETVLGEYEALPPHIRELLVVSLLGPQRAMALGPVPLAVLSDYACYPLTLLYALQNIPTQPEAHISQLSELTVHVVGAEHATDCHPLSRWDAFLLHLLPRLRRLHVVFVGLELEVAGGRPGVTQRDFTCTSCRAAGRRLTCELQPSTAYHTYCRSPQFRPPHVIAAFNAGLYRFAGHESRDTWRETIPHLVRDGVPLILSGYTLLECPQDVARIQQEQKVDVLLPPRKNPYRSTRPQQNFLNEHEAPVVFKNQYVACLAAAAKPPVAAKARK